MLEGSTIHCIALRRGCHLPLPSTPPLPPPPDCPPGHLLCSKLTVEPRIHEQVNKALHTWRGRCPTM